MHVFPHKCLFLVEATGLEPTTFWSLTKRATKLRYASISSLLCYHSSQTAYVIILIVKI